MSRYIDADAFIERAKPYRDKYGAEEFPYCIVHDAFIYEIEEEPTVDAVLVIRCKDCVDRREISYSGGRSLTYCETIGSTVNDDDYCCWAERKEE